MQRRKFAYIWQQENYLSVSLSVEALEEVEQKRLKSTDFVAMMLRQLSKQFSCSICEEENRHSSIIFCCLALDQTQCFESAHQFRSAVRFKHQPFGEMANGSLFRRRTADGKQRLMLLR